MNSAVSRRTRWHLPLTLAAVVVVTQVGCTTGPDPRRLRLPPPPSEALRSQLGRVRLSEGSAQTEALLAGPARGGREGAARGAARGAAIGAEWGGGGGGPYPSPIFIFSIPAGALVGAVVGAARAEPAAEFDAKAQALQAAVEELQVRQTLHRYVGDRLQELTATSGSRAMLEEPASTIIEVVVEQVGLADETQPDELQPINPPLSFVLTERTRLVRASDGAELYGHRLTYRGRPRPFADWFVHNSINAMPLREEAERACRELAERLVDEVFLRYLPSAD